MRPLKVLVCDDTKNPLSGIVGELEALKPVGSPLIELISGQAISDLAKGLEARRKSAAHGAGPGGAPTWGDHTFDAVDILILDYNFIDLEEISGLTGQRLAYLARCYSACKFIVVLNQFGTNRFDLTLRDHPETHADIHLGADQIARKGLWSADDWEEFRPWSWPVLPTAVAKFEARVTDLSGQLDQPVLKWLGLDEDAIALPRSIAQFLRTDNTTFREFVTDSGHGFEPGDKAFHDSSLVVIAASRIAKWLEYMVLAGQDVLVDLPRLLSRFPSLLEEGGLETLAGKAFCPSLETGLRPVTQKVNQHAYTRPDWVSRSTWFRSAVMDDMSIRENAEGLPPDTDLRFAEDTSRLLPSADTRGFVADLASPYVQRFVKRRGFDGVEYQPSVRFSL